MEGDVADGDEDEAVEPDTAVEPDEAVGRDELEEDDVVAGKPIVVRIVGDADWNTLAMACQLGGSHTCGYQVDCVGLAVYTAHLALRVSIVAIVYKLFIAIAFFNAHGTT